MFYDRPQGNQVFDLITNPPATQTPSLQWGLVSGLATATPLYSPVGLQPNEYAWKPPVVYQWNLGFQMQLPANFTLDLSYVGSESRDLLNFRNLNAVNYGTAYDAAYQDLTRGQTCTGCSSLSTLPGGNALPTDFLRPYRGYTDIRLWEMTGYANYKSLQTTVSRRLNKGLMFSGYYAYSQAKGIGGDDRQYARIDGKDREAYYGPLSFDRPHSFVANFVYQTPPVSSGALGWLTNDWMISGNYRWVLGHASHGWILDSRLWEREPHGQPDGRRPHRPDRSGSWEGLQLRPVQSVQRGGVHHAEARQHRPRVAAFHDAQPADQHHRPLGGEVAAARRPPAFRDPSRRVQRPQSHAVHRDQPDH